MENLYHQTNKLLQQVQSDLGRLERASSDDVHLVENQVQIQIDHIVSNCERLEILVNKEPPTRRASAKMRVDQLKYDCQHIQAALRNLVHRRYQHEEDARERDALMSRSFTANEDTSIYIDASLHHNTKLNDASRNLGDIIDSGSLALTNMKEQRMTLKGAHKKILDIANTLGLSNTVMRLIERRSYQDKYILFGGMFVTCVIMYLVIAYLI